MALIKLVEENEASPEIKEIYNQFKQFFELDFVPSIIKATAHEGPEVLRQTFEQLKSSEEILGKETTYLLGLAVDVTNGCDYCINFDTAMLKRMGYDDKKINALINFIAANNYYNKYADALQLQPDVTPQTIQQRKAA